MMANAAEYQTTIYELFWNGNAPTQMETADGKAGKSVTTPKAELDKLAEMREMARKLREQGATQ